jgi:phage terminase large subunit
MTGNTITKTEIARLKVEALKKQGAKPVVIQCHKDYHALMTQKKAFKVVWGGRAGQKTTVVSAALVVKSYEIPKIQIREEKVRTKYFDQESGQDFIKKDISLKKELQPFTILCLRQFSKQNDSSVYDATVSFIKENNLENDFSIVATKRSIINKTTGNKFLFMGMARNKTNLKGIHNVKYCWIDEGQEIEKDSWDLLVPTIRYPESEIWITMNPNTENDVIWRELIAEDAERRLVDKDRVLVININYDKNIFWNTPACENLRREMESCKARNYEEYLHIWEGRPKSFSDAVIFGGRYQVHNFITHDIKDIDGKRFYYGMDFGLRDPTILVRCYIVINKYGGKELYIDKEAGGSNLDSVDKIDECLTSVFNDVDPVYKARGIDKYLIKNQLIYADSAELLTIGSLKQKGWINMRAVEKGAGSVMEGIKFLLNFDKIHIHSSCKTVANEFANYSYKTDKYTGKPIPNEPLDKDNHGIDALRYALSSIILNLAGNKVLFSNYWSNLINKK